MFETNSSSAHSIVLCTEPYEGVSNIEELKNSTNYRGDKSIYHIGYGYKDLNDMSFCRQEAHLYNTPLPKAQILILLYAMSIVVDALTEEEYKEKMTEYCDRISKIFWKEANMNVIVEYPPIEVDWHSKSYFYVNIEEEGLFELYDILKRTASNSGLCSYLFDNRSFVVLAGDEYHSTYEIQTLMGYLKYAHEVIGYETENRPYTEMREDWEYSVERSR